MRRHPRPLFKAFVDVDSVGDSGEDAISMLCKMPGFARLMTRTSLE